MNSARTIPLLSLVLALAGLAIMLALAPSAAALWQKILGGLFCVTFAYRLAPLLVERLPASTRLARLAAALPVLFLVVAALGLPAPWAVMLAVTAWLAAFLMRRAA